MRSVDQRNMGQRLRAVSKDLGLWGLDAPEDLGGHDLSTRTMAVVHEELEREALEWSTTRGSRSGRVAWQFTQELAGRLGIRIAGK